MANQTTSVCYIQFAKRGNKIKNEFSEIPRRNYI